MSKRPVIVPISQNGSEKSPLDFLRFPFLAAFSHKELMVPFMPCGHLYCQNDEVSTVCTGSGGSILGSFWSILVNSWVNSGQMKAKQCQNSAKTVPKRQNIAKTVPKQCQNSQNPVKRPCKPSPGTHNAPFGRLYEVSECVLIPLGSPWTGPKVSYVHVPVDPVPEGSTGCRYIVGSGWVPGGYSGWVYRVGIWRAIPVPTQSLPRCEAHRRPATAGSGPPQCGGGSDAGGRPQG